MDGRLQPNHRGHAWGIRVVNYHRRVEIPTGEHADDVIQVDPDLVNTRSVFRVIRDYDNFSTVPQQMKVVRRQAVREAHFVVPPLVNALVARLRGRRGLLC